MLADGAPYVTIGGKQVGRIGDPVSCGSTVMEGEASVVIGDQGGEKWGREFAFSLVKNAKDKLVLCLPEMAAAQAERENVDNRQGWIYLHDFVVKWLSKRSYIIPDADKFNLGGQEPTLIEWDWLMTYKRFRDAADELTTEKYLTEANAKKKLTEILENDGTFSEQVTFFDHTVLPKDKSGKIDWEELRKHAFHGKTVSHSKMLAPDKKPIPDGLTAAMGSLTVYALAAGETHVSATGEKRIVIRKIGRFVYDGFDFSGDQWLGNWECSEEYKGFKSADASLEFPVDLIGKELGLSSRLDNRAFRNFRNRTGYGFDFRVICLPDVVNIDEFSYIVP
ncbi:MAG: DUF6402 family protein [Desulfobulbaceae bacterium]|nr:DUF6402 family protein [Desulfobulbaceae bacterium]